MVEPAPETTRLIVPDPAPTFTFVTGAVSVLPPCTVTVAAGTPVKTILLVVPEFTVVVVSNVIVTCAEPPPNVKSLVDVEMTAPLVVIRFVPVRGPTMETP